MNPLRALIRALTNQPQPQPQPKPKTTPTKTTKPTPQPKPQPKPTPPPQPTTAPQPLDTTAPTTHQTGQLWVQLSRLHLELYNIPPTNTPLHIQQRRALLDRRAPLLQQYLALWQQIHASQTTAPTVTPSTTTPTNAVATAPPSNSKTHHTASDDSPSSKKTKKETPPPAPQTADQYKRIHAIKTNITRTQNQLNYQSNTRQPTPNPLPDCPRRQKLLQKLHHLQTLLDTLQQ